MKAKSFMPLLLLTFVWGGYYVSSHKALEHMSVFAAGIVIRFITMILLTIKMIWKKELGSLLQVKGILIRLLVIAFILFEEKMVIQQYIGIVIVLTGALGIVMEQRKKESQRIEEQV